VSAEILPTVLGIALVAAAAAFALVPFARASFGSASVQADESAPAVDRLVLYRHILELEFDFQMGKLSRDDFEHLSANLLASAGAALREERGTLSELDEEIEREIAAARAAFAAARSASSGGSRVGTPT
jgi:hypothetical protein